MTRKIEGKWVCKYNGVVIVIDVDDRGLVDGAQIEEDFELITFTVGELQEEMEWMIHIEDCVSEMIMAKEIANGLKEVVIDLLDGQSAWGKIKEQTGLDTTRCLEIEALFVELVNEKRKLSAERRN